MHISDYSNYTAGYSNFCQAAGGKFYTGDAKFDCTETSSGRNADVWLNDFGGCFGSVCTRAEIDVDTVVFPVCEQIYAIQGFTCNLVDETNISAGTRIAGSTTNSVWALISALMTMAAFFAM